MLYYIANTVNVEIFAFFASETISRVKIFARGSHVIPGQRPRKFSSGVYFRGKDLNRENSENFHHAKISTFTVYMFVIYSMEIQSVI